MIEVLSPGTRRRDEGIKRKLFDERGVREYWLVDPQARRVAVCRRAPDGSFPVIATLAAAWDGHLTTPLLPDFSLSVKQLFADA